MRAPLAAVCLSLILTGSLFAQGLTTTATKDDWEEINFEFDSSVLTDGYPSLLRLAELLQKNPGFRVKVEGHTDFRGTDGYNETLALARAATVRDFLLKYGAPSGQIEVSGRGEAAPKVDNRTAEGRFMNRRVTLYVTDAQGRAVSAGGVGEAIRAMSEPAKQPDCCADILKKLDKLDEIVSLLRDLKAENDQLKKDVAGLKAAQSGLKKEVERVVAAPKPPEPAAIAKAVESAVEKAMPKSRRFSLLGLNAGPDMTGNVTFTGKGRFFAPFNETFALQAEGEYQYHRDRQEGQFDLGLVNRIRNVQAGLFSSFKYANIREFDRGGTLGQGALTVDYLFSRGRVGFFGTKGFRDNVGVNRRVLGRNIFEESYLKIVDQIGGSTQIGLRKDSYVEGNLGALIRRGGDNRPGGIVRFVQPISPAWAFTVEAGLNETLIGPSHSGRVAVGVQLGNWVRPKEFAGLKHPVPVDIPRLRYEVLKRRVRTGNDAPIADAGADQQGVDAGVKTLDGSASFDPDGDPITFQWQQIGGPAAALSGAATARATFTAAEGQTYAFRLTVKDDGGLQGVDRVVVTTLAAPEVKIVRFTANPSTIRAGQTTTLVWEVLNADEVTISPVLGRVDVRGGTSTVAPVETTTYRLTARNRRGEVNEAVTVTVERPEVRILRFTATPATINRGEASTLSWETENATEVTIRGIGTVRPNGTAPVSPTETTTYTLTARNRFGEVTATATVQVVAGPSPRIIRFAATPVEVLPGEQSTLLWEVENATEVSIEGIGSVQLTGTSVVTPADTTTYRITAGNARGRVSATAVVGVIRPVKILDFVADPPSTTRRRQPVTLRWSTQNATEVVITGVGSVPVNGSIQVMPESTVSYSLVAYGKRSQATAFVVVKVGPAVNSPPVADAGPDLFTYYSDLALDGSRSFDPDGDPITYSWRVVGPQQVNIIGGNTARPRVQLLSGMVLYTFELTVTDDKGASSRDTMTVNYNDP